MGDIGRLWVDLGREKGILGGYGAAVLLGACVRVIGPLWGFIGSRGFWG